MTILGRGLLGQPLSDDSLLVGNSGILDELPVGTLNQVLTVTGSGVDWVTPTFGTITQIDTGVALTGGPITTTGTIDLDISTLSSLVGVAAADELLIFDSSSSTHQRVTVAELDLAIGPNVLDDLTDVTVGNPPGAGQDGFVLTWNNGAGEFQLTAAGAGSVTEAFTTIVTDLGTNVVADTASDTLTLSGGEVINTTGDASADNVTVDLDITGTTSLGVAPDGSDEIVIYDVSAGVHRKTTVGLLPTGGSGEINTASNAGSGVGVFDQKIGIDLVFNSILGNVGIDATLNSNTIELDLDIPNLPLLTTGLTDDDFIALYENGAGLHFRVPLSALPFLLPSNNLSDVDNSLTAIDNLTTTNRVTVDQLQFVDHGANGMMWLIEEDGSASTQALTFDYSGIERIRFTPTGGARFDGVVELNGAVSGDLKVSGGASVIDDNNNTILSFNEAASAVNWIDIQNAATNTRPELTVLGSDTAGTGLGLDITTRTATTTGNGGQLRLVTGNGFDTGDGGTLTLSAGTSGGTAGDGGDVTVTAGSSLGGADGNGGQISISAGSNLGGVGDVGDGGLVSITAGNSVDGDGGDVRIFAGQGADASTSSNTGGSVLIKPGPGVTGASDGTIKLQNINNTTIVEVLEEEIRLLPHGAGLGATTELLFLELAANGQNYVGFHAPDSIASNVLWTLPDADGTGGQVLTTDGSGILSWVSVGGVGTVTSVGSGVGLSGGPITGSGTLNLDIDSLTVEAILTGADTLAFFDDSASAHRKMTLSSLTTFVTTASALNDLTDVTVPTPSTADYLRFSAGQWRNEQLTISDDASPTLGGNLDVNGFDIVSISNGDIFISPDGAGNVVLDGLIWPSADGTLGQSIVTDGSGNLSFETRLANVVEDITPQLGGDLDVNGNSIISVSSGDIPITPDGTGNIILDGLIWPSTDGGVGDVLTTDGSGNLSFSSAGTGTVTSVGLGSSFPGFVIGSSPVTTSGTIIIDHDWTGFPPPPPITPIDLILSSPTPGGPPGSHIVRPIGDLGIGSGGFLMGALVDDTTPSLGGDLDTAGFCIEFDDGTGIKDDSSNEQLIFNKTASAVNNFEMTNAATGSGPDLSVDGADTNIDMNVTPKGDGRFVLGGISYSKRQTLTIVDATTNSSFFTYPHATNEVTFIDYGLVRTGDGSRAGTLTIITDGSSVSIADTGTDISAPGVTFTAIVSGSDIIIRYTSTSTGNAGSMAYSIRQWDV